MSQMPDFPLKPQDASGVWENVHVFVSSTFNDMHAERDFLVKRVFPYLADWCERRCLHLVDIDLRWGVSEADAAENKKVVQVCLERIDDCRPFFLCFLGQRRGWLPDFETEVSGDTRRAFDKLDAYEGASVTEMEIIHARIDPLHNGRLFDAQGNPRDGSAVEHAFFFLRQDGYLHESGFMEHPEREYLSCIYTNASRAERDPSRREGALEAHRRADEKLAEWRDLRIPNAAKGKNGAKDCPVVRYTAEWLPDSQTPEISWPLAVPSFASKASQLWGRAFARWREQWADAGVAVSADGAIIGEEFAKACDFNRKLTSGRLGKFFAGSRRLEDIILEQLKGAISARHATHREREMPSPLHRELAEQARHLRLAAEGYIPMGGMFGRLDEYLQNGRRPLCLRAKSGMGKSSLIAAYIQQSKHDMLYRFAGVGDLSTPEQLVRSIVEELRERGVLSGEIPASGAELLRRFPSLLEEAARNRPLIVVVDALDQLEGGLIQTHYLPRALPDNARFIFSYQEDADGAEAFSREVESFARLCRLPEVMDPADKEKYIRSYFRKYFKDLDDMLLGDLMGLEGSDNPLYLKIILNELRVFGSYDKLKEKINNDHNAYGATPLDAFSEVLRRLENESGYYTADAGAGQCADIVFGWLSHSRSGLSVDELCALVCKHGLVVGKEAREAVRDMINGLYQQMRAYLVRREGRIDFFYHSFRRAALARYGNARPSKVWHGELAAYFGQPDTAPARRLHELAFQLARAKLLAEYDRLLGDFSHHEAQLRQSGGTAAIAEDCGFYQDHPGAKFLRAFYDLAGATLASSPEQLPGELWGRFRRKTHPLCDALLDDALRVMRQRRTPWLRPRFPYLDGPEQHTQMRLQADSELRGPFALADDRNILYTLDDEYVLSVWNLQHGQVIARRSFGEKEFASEVQLSPDGHLLAVHYDEHVLLLNAFTLEERRRLESILPYHGDEPGHATRGKFVFTPDSRYLVTSDASRGIRLHDVLSGQIVHSVEAPGEAFSFAFGGNVLAAGCLHPDRQHEEWKQPWFVRKENPAALFDYDPAQGTLTLRQRLDGYKDSVRMVAVSPDGRYAATSEDYGHLWLWDANACANPLRRIDLDRSGITTLEFSPDAATLVAGGMDGVLRIFSVPSLEWIGEIPCRFGSIKSARLSRDGTRCVVLSDTMPREFKVMSLLSPPQKRAFSRQIYRIGKVSGLNAYVASSHWDRIRTVGYEPTRGDIPRGMICFFDADNNVIISAKPLLGARNEDFVFIDPGAERIVSKDCLRADSYAATIRHWALEKFPTLQGDLVGQMFPLKATHSAFLKFNSRLVRFSARYNYAVFDNEGQGTLDVYRTASGRFIGSLNWKPEKFMMQDMGKASEFDENLDDNSYDLSADGKLLYALNAASGILRICKLKNGKGKVAKTIRIKNYTQRGNSSDEYAELILRADGRELFYHCDRAVMVINTSQKAVVYRLGRKKNETGEDCGENYVHASLSPDGRLLGLSQQVDSGEILEVWDTRADSLVARYIADGHISNILIDGNTFTFGSVNGEICTLYLENYSC